MFFPPLPSPPLPSPLLPWRFPPHQNTVVEDGYVVQRIGRRSEGNSIENRSFGVAIEGEKRHNSAPGNVALRIQENAFPKYHPNIQIGGRKQESQGRIRAHLQLGM